MQKGLSRAVVYILVYILSISFFSFGSLMKGAKKFQKLNLEKVSVEKFSTGID